MTYRVLRTLQEIIILGQNCTLRTSYTGSKLVVVVARVISLLDLQLLVLLLPFAFSHLDVLEFILYSND